VLGRLTEGGEGTNAKAAFDDVTNAEVVVERRTVRRVAVPVHGFWFRCCDTSLSSLSM